MPFFFVPVIKTLGDTQFSYSFFSADLESEHGGPDQIVQRSTSGFRKPRATSLFTRERRNLEGKGKTHAQPSINKPD